MRDHAVIIRGDQVLPIDVAADATEVRTPEHRPEYGFSVVDGRTVPNFGVVIYRWDGIERDAENRRVFR
jgi:hypothetical protein